MSKGGRAGDWIGPLAGRRTRREQDPRPHCDDRALAHIAVYSRGSSVVAVAPFAERLRWSRALSLSPTTENEGPLSKPRHLSVLPRCAPAGLPVSNRHIHARASPRDQSRVTPILCTLIPLTPE